MADIDFPRFARMLERCREVATAADADAAVKRVYDDQLGSLAQKFLAAHAGLPAAETAAGTERAQAEAALAAIDQPYRKARAVARAYVPEISLPETLKVLPTDTDKLAAIQSLLDELDRRDDSEAWAREQLEGEFGTRAPEVIREVREWIAANVSLAKAREARSSAYLPAYERYVDYKNVVRNTYGPRSAQYRRIHIRRGTDRDPTPAS